MSNPERIIKATEDHAKISQEFEAAVYNAIAGAPGVDVHPMMIGALHAMANAAAQLIKSATDNESIAWLINDLEKDCVEIIKVLRGMLTERGIPNGGRPQ